jgi:hypothetical protein
LALASLGSASLARADRGALTLDIGTGLTVLAVPAPYAENPKSQLGTMLPIWFGSRYALSHSVEVAASILYEPKVTYLHSNATVTTSSNGSFQGSLQHNLTQYGGLVGVRFVHGFVFRLCAGMEVGLSVRNYSQVQHFDVSNPSGPTDWGLNLKDFTVTNGVLAPLAGIEWAFADHFSVSFMPRVQILLGRESTFAVTAPLLFSWSWYL